MKRVAGGQPVFGDVIMIGTVENETSSGNPYEVLKEDELLNKLNVSRKHAERGWSEMWKKLLWI